MSVALQRGLSFWLLIAACLVAFASIADARPSKQGLHRIAGDSEFAALHMRAAYAPSRRPVTQPPLKRVAAIDSSAGSPTPPPQRVAAIDSSAGSPARSSLVSEARRWIGTNPTGRSSLWCGDFMNFVLSRTGHRVHNSRSARSFASYGKPLAGPQIGAIAVMSRGAHGGHVGIVTGIDRSGNPIVISGNVEKRVEEIPYPRSRIIAYVAP